MGFRHHRGRQNGICELIKKQMEIAEQRAVRLPVIAFVVGEEDEAICNLLLQMACDHAPGWLISAA